VSNDNEIGNGQMLHHAHFYMKGGERSFAALCTEVGYADFASVSRTGSKVSLQFSDSVLITWD
jgi:hypothetical protein